MNRVILQVPMSKELKEAAEAVSSDYGFSSLQEVLRVLVRKLAKRELEINISETEVIKLSKRAEKRYAKMDEDFKKGRNVYYAKSVEDLMTQLSSK